jgi:hypothetical protein
MCFTCTGLLEELLPVLGFFVLGLEEVVLLVTVIVFRVVVFMAEELLSFLAVENSIAQNGCFLM